MTQEPRSSLTPSNQPRLTLLLTYPGVGMLDLSGPQCTFWIATRYMEALGLSGYNPQVVSLEGGLVRSADGVTFHTKPIADFNDAVVDTIVIPGSPYMVEMSAECEGLAQWLRENSRRARRTASVCSGAFVLAQAGLLDDKRAVTHWAMCDILKARHPSITIDMNAIYIEDGPIWTCAGYSSCIDLTLALVKQDCGHDVAMKSARELVVFLRRPGGQAQFSEQLQSQVAETSEFDELHMWINDHLGENLTVELLADKLLMSPRNFARVYKQKTGRTPTRAIELFRLEAARRLLEASNYRVDEIARMCGFQDEERMCIAFERSLAVSPADYRERFAP